MRVYLEVPRQENRLRHGVDAGARGDEDDAHHPVGNEPSLRRFVLYVVFPLPLG